MPKSPVSPKIPDMHICKVDGDTSNIQFRLYVENNSDAYHVCNYVEIWISDDGSTNWTLYHTVTILPMADILKLYTYDTSYSACINKYFKVRSKYVQTGYEGDPTYSNYITPIQAVFPSSPIAITDLSASINNHYDNNNYHDFTLSWTQTGVDPTDPTYDYAEMWESDDGVNNWTLCKLTTEDEDGLYNHVYWTLCSGMDFEPGQQEEGTFSQYWTQYSGQYTSYARTLGKYIKMRGIKSNPTTTSSPNNLCVSFSSGWSNVVQLIFDIDSVLPNILYSYNVEHPYIYITKPTSFPDKLVNTIKALLSEDGINDWYEYEGSINFNTWTQIDDFKNLYFKVAIGFVYEGTYSDDDESYTQSGSPYDFECRTTTYDYNYEVWSDYCDMMFIEYTGVYDAPTDNLELTYNYDDSTYADISIYRPSPYPSSPMSDYDQMCYHNNMWVCLRDGDIYSSPDGIGWTRRLYGSFNNICYGSGKFVAIDIASHLVEYSTNGTAWSTATDLEVKGHEMYLIIGSGSTLVDAMDEPWWINISSSQNIELENSPDGINWESQAISGTGNDYQFSYEYLNLYIRLRYKFGNYFYFYSDWSDSIHMQYNGRPYEFDIPNDIECIYNFTNDTVDITINHTSPYPESPPESWFTMCYHGNMWVCSVDGEVYSSPDGIEWTIRIAGGDYDRVCYGGGKFIAISNLGTDRIKYSTNGTTWATATNLEVIGYFMYGIIGAGSEVINSTGEVWWMPNTSDNIQLQISPDGINWEDRSVTGEGDEFSFPYPQDYEQTYIRLRYSSEEE